VPGKEDLDRKIIPACQSLMERRVVLDRMGNDDCKSFIRLRHENGATPRAKNTVRNLIFTSFFKPLRLASNGLNYF
jgi:hypothetical protein